MRHTGQEDYRYAAMRRNWEKKGKAYYYVVSFMFVFMMQALFSIIVNASALYVTTQLAKTVTLGYFDYAGLALFTFGFLFEAIADAQLYYFKKDPNNKGKIITTGLWRYTRHPNYFGEASLWWGIYLVACAQPQGYLTFFAPLFITLLVRYVSGVPLLERKQMKNPDFQQYAKETSIFVPWFVNKVAGEGYHRVPDQD
jgi:steroid 5-alpha reductase family enzyme